MLEPAPTGRVQKRIKITAISVRVSNPSLIFISLLLRVEGAIAGPPRTTEASMVYGD
jgi:hypothetical protein